MKNLFIFLLVALIITYVGKPNDKSSALRFAITIPIVSLFIYISVFIMTGNSYRLGQELIMSIIPAIISGIIIFHQMRKKIERENKVELPGVLVLFVVLSLTITILQYSYEVKSRRLLYELSGIASKKQQSKTSSEDPKVLSIVYNGIYVSYPNNWKVITEVVEPGLIYQVSIQKKGISTSELITFLYSKMEIPPEDMIEGIKESLLEEVSHQNTTFGPIKNFYFYGKLSRTLYYTTTYMGLTRYGHIRAYSYDGISVVILKQSDSQSKLDNYFRTMEDSFRIELN